nr:putative ribonuclease H-like domain-containing protein [Tanacetum cinerariifolium]
DYDKVKTINEDVQIRALVNGKKIIVTEASIRRDLQLHDSEGTACLPNDTIFEELARIRDSLFELVAYTDSDYVGASLYKKSTTGGCQFLGRRLISWKCKKQTMVATSTTEAEYVAAASLCRQVLWIQNQMLDYG